jgi:hypothetical protein
MAQMSNADLTIKEYVAERLMQDSGFGDREANPLEWDATNPYSQYATNLDIAEACVNATVEALNSIGMLSTGAETVEEPNNQYTVDFQHPIHRQATVYLFLKAQPGTPLTLGNVKDWLREVEALNLPDNTELEGEISLMYDLGLSSVELTTFENDEEAVLLIPRETTTEHFSPNHPSVVNKNPESLRQKTYEALLKKYTYLLDQKEESEAAKVFEQIQRMKEER